MRLQAVKPSRHSEMLATTRHRTLVACIGLAIATTLGACGFGTTPGPPYDFTRLERVVEPILRLPGLTVVERQETGTDCGGMSCARPVLSYKLRSQPTATFEKVQEFLSVFDGITKPFSQAEAVQDRDPANPRRWIFVGEVMRHAVTVSGDVAAGGKVFGPGTGTADVIRVNVSADRLAI